MHTIQKIDDHHYDITLTRGDSFSMQFALKRGGQDYTPTEGDSIRFAVKRSYSDPDTAVKINKTIPTDTLTLELLPADTKTLSMGFGYVYDIQLTDAAGNVDTFVKGRFKIDTEVL